MRSQLSERVKAQLREFAHLPKVKQGLDALATKLSDIGEVRDRARELTARLEVLRGLREQAERTAIVLKPLQKAAELEPAITKLVFQVDDLEQSIGGLESALASADNSATRVTRAESQLSDAKIELDAFDLCPLCQQVIPKGLMLTHAGSDHLDEAG